MSNSWIEGTLMTRILIKTSSIARQRSVRMRGISKRTGSKPRFQRILFWFEGVFK